MQVFGINHGESLSTAVSFANNFGLTYPVLHDPNGISYTSYSMYGISPYPRDVIIDQNGIIQYMHTEYDPQYMLQIVNDLLGINDVKIEKPDNIPNKFDIHIYPNPFNPDVNISFTIIDSKPVELKIFNVLGQQVLFESYGNLTLGSQATIKINMKEYSSGLYYLQISNGNNYSMEKMVLLR